MQNLQTDLCQSDPKLNMWGTVTGSRKGTTPHLWTYTLQKTGVGRNSPVTWGVTSEQQSAKMLPIQRIKRNGSQDVGMVSVSVSAQDGIVALGKAHTRSAPSLSSLPKVALETVPILVWMNTDHSKPWRVECRPLPFSTPLSFRRSMLWCSGLSMLRKFLKPLSTSALPSCRPDVISAVLVSLSARSFQLTPACPGQ